MTVTYQTHLADRYNWSRSKDWVGDRELSDLEDAGLARSFAVSGREAARTVT